MSNRPLITNIIAGAMEWAIILLPVAIYLLLLAWVVNKQKRPVPVSGPMSFFWLLLGMSGFLFIGPFSWLPHLWRPAGWLHYVIAYGVYCLGVCLLCAWLLYRQRHTLVIYNIDPNDLAGVLEEVLTAMDVPHAVTPGRIAFEDGNLVLDIEASFLFNNVALQWRYAPQSELRYKIEENLRRALVEVDAGPNASSTILSLAATVILTFCMFATVLFVLSP